MKKLFLFIFGLLSVSVLSAQVGIGNDSLPRKGAILDLNSSLKGGLLLSTVEIVALDKIPADSSIVGREVFPGYQPSNDTALAGSIVYNRRNDPQNGILAGVYFWDGKRWIRLKSKS